MCACGGGGDLCVQCRGSLCFSGTTGVCLVAYRRPALARRFAARCMHMEERGRAGGGQPTLLTTQPQALAFRLTVNAPNTPYWLVLGATPPLRPAWAGVRWRSKGGCSGRPERKAERLGRRAGTFTSDTYSAHARTHIFSVCIQQATSSCVLLLLLLSLLLIPGAYPSIITISSHRTSNNGSGTDCNG